MSVKKPIEQDRLKNEIQKIEQALSRIEENDNVMVESLKKKLAKYRGSYCLCLL